MRDRIFGRWSQAVLIALILLGVVTVSLYTNNLSSLHKSGSETYSSVKSFGAAFTVNRTYTSKNNVIVNNLWRPSVQLSGGGSHNCALSNGNIYCWGRGGDGQLGNNGTADSITPIPVVKGTSDIFNGQRMTQISGGQSHMCAVNSGLVACWGKNTNGQLGRASGNTTSSSVPVQVATLGPTLITNQISAGGQSTCAVVANNALCWGDNSKGQLGDGTTTMRTIPPPPTGTPQRSVAPKATASGDALYDKYISQVQVGGLFACAIANGEVYCWGDNTYGQLGNSAGGAGVTSTVPVPVTKASGVLLGKTVTQIATGYDYACAIADGQAYCWGRNTYGQLGRAAGNTTDSNVPIAVKADTGTDALNGKTVTNISSGGSGHTCAIADSKAYCWGRNDYGQLGNGNSPTNSGVPVDVSLAGVLSGKTATQLVGGELYTCAIANGRAYCWGRNDYGQLGTNNSAQTSVNVPYRVNDSYY
ncbi:MAG: hypothetical protein Q7T74_04675 [Candidatus Saccharibacteria bacterium]|nr:hypothetical protein [Candidatus Saccharibacteria bacterium]